MGNACFSGNKDRVGDRGKEKPVEERPVPEEKSVPEEIAVTEGKPVIEEKPVVEEKPVLEEKPIIGETPVSEEKPVEDKPVLGLESLHLPEWVFSFLSFPLFSNYSSWKLF